MMLPAFIVFLGFALQASSLSILLPFYNDPNTSLQAWNDLNAAITKYSQVEWQVIVNPNSGPGTTGPKPEDPAYIDAVSTLNDHDNVITVGYVSTRYAKRPYSEVISDIDVYASWAAYSDANLTIAGIFLDEVIDESKATAENVKFYSDASAHVKTTLKSAVKSVVLNPGTLGPEQLFESCNLMVEAEIPVSSYKGAATIATLPSEYLDQSALILYGASASTDVAGLVQTMVQPGTGVGAVYVDYGACTTDDGRPTGCYTQFNGETLGILAAAIEGAEDNNSAV